MSQMPSAEDLRETELDRLHKSMRLAGLNATSLAARMEVHRNTINAYLAGKTPMTRIKRVAWAFATGVPHEWLESGQVPAGWPGPDGDSLLPRLDSNQQPSGYRESQVRGHLHVADIRHAA